MSNLNNRIYNELADWKYNIEIFNRYIQKKKNWNKKINIGLIIFSLLSIFGWYKLSELVVYWSLILLFVQVVRLFRFFSFTSESEIFEMKTSLDFYVYHILDLENLYYDYYSDILSENVVRKRFEELQKNKDS